MCIRVTRSPRHFNRLSQNMIFCGFWKRVRKNSDKNGFLGNREILLDIIKGDLECRPLSCKTIFYHDTFIMLFDGKQILSRFCVYTLMIKLLRLELHEFVELRIQKKMLCFDRNRLIFVKRATIHEKSKKSLASNFRYYGNTLNFSNIFAMTTKISNS